MIQQEIIDLFDLTGRVAVITGGAKGIGYGITLRLAQAGATCVICDIDKQRVEQTAAELREEGFEVTGYVCDVRDESAVVSFFEKVAGTCGSVDILVNNAGIYPMNKLENVTVEEWDNIYATNVRGMFLCTREAINVMSSQNKGGSIINLSSIGAIRCNRVGMAAYHSSKAAHIGFVNHEAAEQGPKGIRVNAIGVGAIHAVGPNNDGVYTPHTVTDYKPMPKTAIPLARMGNVADIGNACVFLASDMSSFINGIYLTVDGGMLKVPTLGYPE